MSSRVIFDIDRKGPRHCGGCTLCCKLLPVRALDKPANQKCQHAKFGKGCAVYHKPGMPSECHVWSCRWLMHPEETASLSRPDRAHYVLDVMPDYVEVVDKATGKETPLEVVQVWCDPAHSDAHRDPALRAYLARMAEQGIGALVRFNAKDALHLMAPALSHDRQWHEVRGTMRETTHTPAELQAALGLTSKVTLR